MNSLVDKFRRLEHLVGGREQDGWIDFNGVLIKTLYSDNHSVTLAKWNKTAEYPWHFHDGYEILVCIKGSFVIDLQCKCEDSKAQFILNEGGSLFIPPKRPHKAINTTEEAELIGICVPPEPSYKELIKNT